jgi:hypothetical protein
MNFFYIEGIVQDIEEIDEDYYRIEITEKIYKNGPDKKTKICDGTIYYNCICFFTPKVEIGDKVIARGVFKPSKNENYNYSMVIRRIASENRI